MRLALLLSYDGTPWKGWTDVRDAALRPALARVLFRAPPLPLVEAASRTDAGVHARGQVATVDLCQSDGVDAEALDLPQLTYSLNQLLPASVCIRAAQLVSDDFDVRSTRGKEYRYTLSTAACRDPLRRLYEWQLPPRRGAACWDAGAAVDAARLLCGTNSFAAFGNTPRGAERKREVDPVCTLRMVNCRQLGPTTYQFRLRGDRFLYKMARNCVGALVRVGTGELDASELAWALEYGRFERSRSVPLTAPAQGLVLHNVMYSSDAVLFAGATDGRTAPDEAATMASKEGRTPSRRHNAIVRARLLADL